ASAHEGSTNGAREPGDRGGSLARSLAGSRGVAVRRQDARASSIGSEALPYRTGSADRCDWNEDDRNAWAFVPRREARAARWNDRAAIPLREHPHAAGWNLRDPAQHYRDTRPWIAARLTASFRVSTPWISD